MRFLLLLILPLLALSACQEATPEQQIVPAGELTFRTENGMDLAYHKMEPFTGIAQSKFKNGGIFTEQSYKQGKEHGPWVVYYQNGNKQKEGSKHEGADHGVYYEWFESGQLMYEYHFDKGVRVGKWLSWYENGTQYTERNWENGQLNGAVKVWTDEGFLSKEYTYKDNEVVMSRQIPVD